MNGDRRDDALPRLLRLMAERLESFLDGDEDALEGLGEAIERGEYTADDLQTAVLVLRSLANARPGTEPVVETEPGKFAQRVLSAEEREFLSPEAWGYLLDLKRRGSLDDRQVERVLEILSGSNLRPVDVDLARDVATRVALSPNTDPFGDSTHGDFDVVH